MLDPDTIFFRLPSEVSVDELLSKLDVPLHAHPDSTATTSRSWFDTFDWRLFANGLYLAQDVNGWQLVRFSDDHTLVSSGPLEYAPRFWWDFPENNSLRGSLSGTLSVRALIEVLAVNHRTAHINILNSDEKTVLRIKSLSFELMNVQEETQIPSFLGLYPVRGYTSEFRVVRDILGTHGLRPLSLSVYEIVLQHAGKKPGSYSSKFKVSLPAGVSTRDAVRTICQELLSTIRVNMSGIKDDVDTEFLHDFRVAMRRTRSILAQVKHVFPPGRVDHFRRLFSQQSKKTNRLRDLDVYLLNRTSYEAMLPEDLAKGLEPVFRSIESQRLLEHRQVKEVFNLQKLDLINDWEAFLDSVQPESAETRNALLPAVVVASKYIWKQYRKVVRKGRVITDATPDELLHNLRIDCKKLRYLLEFFTALYDETAMKALVQHLKKLQDNLGDFNDYSVQQHDLWQLLRDFKADEGEVRQVAAATGGLIMHLHQKQRTVRMAFASTFNNFSSDENQETFRQLFATGGSS